MNLTWHIVRKDARRVWIPLLLWYALGLAHELLPARFAADPLAAPEVFDLNADMLTFLEGFRWVIGLILAAWLVLEDPVTGTSTAWPTRPISGGRLLGAKLLGAVLLLGILPLLVSLPFWIGAGFSGWQMAGVVVESWALQGTLIIVSMSVAAVSLNAAQYLVRGVSLVAGLLLWMWLLRWGGRGDNLAGERMLLSIGLLLGTAPVVLVHQYLTRHTRRTWTVAAAMLVLASLCQLFWPWGLPEVLDNWGRRNVRQDDSADAALVVRLADLRLGPAPTLAKSDWHGLAVRAELSGVTAEQSYRISWLKGQWQPEDGSAGPEAWLGFSNREDAKEQAEADALRKLGLIGTNAGVRQVTLQGTVHSEVLRGMEAGPARLRGKFYLKPLDVQVMGEFPLRVGARVEVGSSRSRLLSLERDEAGRVVVRLAETEARLFTKLYESHFGFPKPRPFSRQWPVQDVFVLLNRKSGLVQVLDAGVIGAAVVNGRFLGQRVLAIQPPVEGTGPRAREVAGWDDGTVIVKVRVAPGEGAVERTFAAGPLTLNR